MSSSDFIFRTLQSSDACHHDEIHSGVGFLCTKFKSCQMWRYSLHAGPSALIRAAPSSLSLRFSFRKHQELNLDSPLRHRRKIANIIEVIHGQDGTVSVI